MKIVSLLRPVQIVIRNRRPFLLIPIILLFIAGSLLLAGFLGLRSYPKEIVNDKPLVLQGDDTLEITDTHYVQKNMVVLRDNARLVIRNSLFEHLQDYSFQYTLEATDKAEVIIKDSEIRSSSWLNWNFAGESSLVLEDAKQIRSDIWHSFGDKAKATVRNSKFHGTMSSQVSFDIENSPDTFIELVYPTEAVINEELSHAITDYSFPNGDDQNIEMNLRIKKSTATSWGITVGPRSTVTIRNANPLIVTLAAGWPWNGVTVSLDNLRPMHYEDQTWKIEDTSLRLINVQTGKWSPIVGGNNTLIIKNSDLADNAFSWGNAKILIENSTASFLRAKESVEMTVKDSVISGDVVAADNGKIMLVNTKVKGKIVEEGNGHITVT